MLDSTSNIMNNNEIFTFADIKTIPLQPNYHLKMLGQLKGYHLNAKRNAKFSLLSSLEIFSKFVVCDPWLNNVVNEEISFLKYNKIVNPYHFE